LQADAISQGSALFEFDVDLDKSSELVGKAKAA